METAAINGAAGQMRISAEQVAATARNSQPPNNAIDVAGVANNPNASDSANIRNVLQVAIAGRGLLEAGGNLNITG